MHARVLQPAADGVAECRAQIDRLVAQPQAARFTGEQAEKGRSGLLAKLADATAKLDQGKFQAAVSKLTDFQGTVRQLLAAGKTAPADAGALLDAAALAFASIQSPRETV